MKTLCSILLCTIFVPIFSCKDNTPDNLLMAPDSSFAATWENKTEYKEAQDYIKNLDYSLLDNPNTHPILKRLLSIIEKTVEGESLEVIPIIQDALDSVQNETIRRVYLDLVYELLIDAGKYKAAQENFPQYERADVLAFGKFPVGSYLKATVDNKLSKLTKANIGYISLGILVNNVPVMGFFDTGSDLSHLSRSFAEKIGLTINTDQRITVYTSNSKDVYGYPAYIEELSVGNVMVKNHPVLVFEDETLTIDHKGERLKLDFTLGWSLIRQVKFRLDFINNTYKADLSKKTNKGFRNLFWFGYPGLKVNTTDGQSLIFGFDSGAARTELRMNGLKKITSLDLSDEIVEVGGLGGIEKVKAKVATNASLLLAAHKITFKRIEILEGQDMYFIAQDGTIGADIFQNNIIILDYQNGILHIEEGR